MVKYAFRVLSVLSLILLVSLVAACGGEGEKKAEKGAGQDPVPMKVVKAETRVMPNWGEFVGQIAAFGTIEIRARVAGFLQEMKFDGGQAVKKGQLLYVIDPKPFEEDLKQAQSGLASNQALLNKSKKDYQRFKKLFEEGVVSRDEFESHQTERATYQANVSDSQAKVENARIQLGYTKIYAPIDGLISRTSVDVGNLVGQGENTLLATVSSQDPVYVSFSVSESDYIKGVRSDQRTTDRVVKLVLSDGNYYEHDGKFDMVDPTIDPQTGTLGIRVTFPNPDGFLRPGQYAKVRVLISKIADAIVVPVRAVMDVQGMKSLYVVGEDGKVKNQPVKLGFEVDNLVVVNEGIKDGDMVIADGVRRVKPGMEIKPVVVPIQSGDQPIAESKSE